MRRLNPDCDAYAKHAIEQNAANRSQNCGFGNRDNRWHDSYDDHYDWCLHADATLRASQTAYRNQALDECSRRTTPPAGTGATISLSLAFTQGFGRTLVVAGSGFEPGEHVAVHVQTTVDGVNGAAFDGAPSADSVGRIHSEFSVTCAPRHETVFAGTARGLSRGRTAIGGVSC